MCWYVKFEIAQVVQVIETLIKSVKSTPKENENTEVPYKNKALFQRWKQGRRK